MEALQELSKNKKNGVRVIVLTAAIETTEIVKALQGRGHEGSCDRASSDSNSNSDAAGCWVGLNRVPDLSLAAPLTIWVVAWLKSSRTPSSSSVLDGAPSFRVGRPIAVLYRPWFAFLTCGLPDLQTLDGHGHRYQPRFWKKR
jgi:hypothetical protein